MKDSIVSFEIFGLTTDLLIGQDWIKVNSIFTANRFDNEYGLMNDSIFYETSGDNTIRTFVETILKDGYNNYYDLVFICSDNKTLSNIDSLKFDLRLQSGKIIKRKTNTMNINGLQQ